MLTAKEIQANVVIVVVPSGLMMAVGLGRRGVRCALLEAQVAPVRLPKANATSARTVEHYRRRGFAHLARVVGLQANHPQDVTYCTRLAGRELPASPAMALTP